TREPGHLGEVAHGGLARVSLPVGVGDEAHRGVEGGVRRRVREALRVERQPQLAALQQVHREAADGIEEEQAYRVFLPAHLARRLDSAQAVDGALERNACPYRPTPP